MPKNRGEKGRLQVLPVLRMLAVSVLVANIALSPVPSAAAQSGGQPFREESDIPRAPTAPPKLGQVVPRDVFRCQRTFVYQGQALPCDSYVRQDGEGLRKIIQDVPSAVEELDTYQRNRRNVRNAAYVTTAGILLVALGYIINRPPIEHLLFPLSNITIHPGGYLVLAGLGATLGGFAYGFGTLKTNESHLNSAVQEFNRVNPNTPITLQFSTGIAF